MENLNIADTKASQVLHGGRYNIENTDYEALPAAFTGSFPELQVPQPYIKKCRVRE